MATSIGFHRVWCGSILAIALICASIPAANAVDRNNSTMIELESSRIVGGNQAALGEYPYFGTYFGSQRLHFKIS